MVVDPQSGGTKAHASLCFLCAVDVTGLWPRTTQQFIDSLPADVDAPTRSPLFPEEMQAQLRQAVDRYFDVVCQLLTTEFSAMMRLEFKNARAEYMRGEIPQDMQDK